MANTRFRSFILALFSSLAIQFVANTALADLVTYWTFNEGTFTDSSGNGYTGASAGTAPTITNDGKVGKTFYGNAEGKYNINVSVGNVNMNNFSVSFWGKQTGANWKDYISVFSTYGDSDFQRADNSLCIYNSPWGTFSANTNISSGFHHIVFTSDASTGDAKLYVDGDLKSTIHKTDINGVISNIMLGGNYSTGNRNSTATVDEVQFYNQALTAEQVSFLYNNPSLYSATVYQRSVTANGNWSDADWNANGQTGQTFANSSAVELTATNSPTLTVDTPVTVNSIDFNGSMTVAGSNAITFNGEKRITVAIASDTATISAPIKAQYDNGITKDGAGKLSLTAANTYTGGTTITGGTLAVSTVNSLGTGAVTVNGGTLDASPAGKTKTFANGIVVGENGGTVTVASGDYSSFASISGSGNLTTNGYVHFNGTGGYNGHLTVNSGFARINPGAFGVFDLTINNKSNFNVFNSGTIQIGKLNATTDTCLFGSSASNQYVFEIGAGTTSSDSASYAGYIRGSAKGAYNVTIKKVGEGTQTFCRTGYGYASPENSIKEVIVDGGKMIINANHSVYSAESTVGYWGSAPITINAGGTLVYDHVWNTSPNTMLTINGGTLTLNKAQYQNAITFNSGTVNGSDELRAGYNGTGVWTVKGGTSTINNKVVLVKSGNHTTFTVNFDSGATLDVKKNITGLNKYTGTNVIFNGTGENPGNILLYTASGVMSGLGSITFNNMNASIAKDGTSFWDYGYFNASSVTLKDSTLTTSRDHSTNGTTFTLDHGTLTANGAVNSYIANVYLKNGSTINGTTDGSTFRTGHQWNSNFYTLYDNGQPENVMNEISADIAMYNTGRTMTFDIADKAPLTVSGSFVPAASGHYNALVKTGAGTLTLTGQNSYSTTTISEGKLVVSGSGTLGTKDVTIVQNATLEFAPDSVQNVGNSISGAGAVIKSGSGTLTLTKVPGYTGATTVESGTLILSAGGTLYNLSGEGDVNYGENAITLNNAANSTFSGDILGSGALTKTGTGTLTLSQAPEYTGSTTIEQGTLALSDGGTLYNLSGGSVNANDEITTSVTLDASGKALTLDNSETTKFIGSIKAASIEKTGDGTLQIYCTAAGQVDPSSFVVSSGRLDMKEYYLGSMEIESGAELSPGNSIGELTITDSLTLDSGSKLIMEIGGSEFSQNDQLIVLGDLVIEEGAIIELVLSEGSTLGPNQPFEVKLTSSNAGTLDDDDAVINALRSSYFTNLVFENAGSYYRITGDLDANAVPEPSTWALLALGVIALFLRKRVRS